MLKINNSKVFYKKKSRNAIGDMTYKQVTKKSQFFETHKKISSVQSINNEFILTLNHNQIIQQKQYQRLIRIAYYQAGKTVVQTLLPQHPPVSFIMLNPSGITSSTSADIELPNDSTSNTQICSFLESRLIGFYGGKATSQLFEYEYEKKSLFFNHKYDLSTPTLNTLSPVHTSHTLRTEGKKMLSTIYPSFSTSKPIESNQLHTISEEEKENDITWNARRTSTDTFGLTPFVIQTPFASLEKRRKIPKKLLNGKVIAFKAEKKVAALQQANESSLLKYLQKRSQVLCKKIDSVLNQSPNNLSLKGRENKNSFFKKTTTLAQESQNLITKLKSKKDFYNLSTTLVRVVSSSTKSTFEKNRENSPKADHQSVDNYLIPLPEIIPITSNSHVISPQHTLCIPTYPYITVTRVPYILNIPTISKVGTIVGKWYVDEKGVAKYQSTLVSREEGSRVKRVKMLTNSKYYTSERNNTDDGKVVYSYSTGDERDAVREKNSKNKSIFAGAGNNLFQSNIGTTEIQTATQLANIMVNNWNFYSFNRMFVEPVNDTQPVNLKKSFSIHSKINNVLSLSPKVLANSLSEQNNLSAKLVDTFFDKQTNNITTINQPFFDCSQNKINKTNLFLEAYFNSLVFTANVNISTSSNQNNYWKNPNQNNKSNKLLKRFNRFFQNKNKKNKIARSEKIQKITPFCENSLSKRKSYNNTRISIENVGKKQFLKMDIFHLINLFQFSNVQRDRFYLSWFRLYLPDIEATTFLKNVANSYFNLGVQTLIRPSTDRLCYRPFSTTFDSRVVSDESDEKFFKKSKILNSISNIDTIPYFNIKTALFTLNHDNCDKGNKTKNLQQVFFSLSQEATTNNLRIGRGLLRSIAKYRNQTYSGAVNISLLFSKNKEENVFNKDHICHSTNSSRLNLTKKQLPYLDVASFLLLEKQIFPIGFINKIQHTYIPSLPPVPLPSVPSLMGMVQGVRYGSKPPILPTFDMVGRVVYSLPPVRTFSQWKRVPRIPKFAKMGRVSMHTITPKVGIDKVSSKKLIHTAISKVGGKVNREASQLYATQYTLRTLCIPTIPNVGMVAPAIPPKTETVGTFIPLPSIPKRGERSTRTLPLKMVRTEHTYHTEGRYGKEMVCNTSPILHPIFGNKGGANRKGVRSICDTWFVNNNSNNSGIANKTVNNFPNVGKQLIHRSLINNCFTKAYLLINQNRQLLDYFVDYLIRFQVVRQHQILYLFSAILLNCKK